MLQLCKTRKWFIFPNEERISRNMLRFIALALFTMLGMKDNWKILTTGQSVHLEPLAGGWFDVICSFSLTMFYPWFRYTKFLWHILGLLPWSTLRLQLMVYLSIHKLTVYEIYLYVKAGFNCFTSVNNYVIV